DAGARRSRRPAPLPARFVAWQAAAWLFRLASIYWFLRAFAISGGLQAAALVLVIQSVASVVPFTPGGAGLGEGLLAYRVPAQVSIGAIIGFSAGMDLALAAVNALLGFAAIALTLRTLRWRRALRRPRSAPTRGR